MLKCRNLALDYRYQNYMAMCFLLNPLVTVKTFFKNLYELQQFHLGLTTGSLFALSFKIRIRELKASTQKYAIVSEMFKIGNVYLARIEEIQIFTDCRTCTVSGRTWVWMSLKIGLGNLICSISQQKIYEQTECTNQVIGNRWFNLYRIVNGKLVREQWND